MVGGPSEAWMGTVHVLAPIGIGQGAGYWELCHVVEADVSTAAAVGSNLPEPGLSILMLWTCFGVAVSAAASSVHLEI